MLIKTNRVRQSQNRLPHEDQSAQNLRKISRKRKRRMLRRETQAQVRQAAQDPPFQYLDPPEVT